MAKQENKVKVLCTICEKEKHLKGDICYESKNFFICKECCSEDYANCPVCNLDYIPSKRIIE